MSHQLTFADCEFNNKRRKTRKEVFLARMNELMPWEQLEAVIEPFYPKVGNGRRPYPHTYYVPYSLHATLVQYE
jgi:IS5 family transposase